MSHKQLTLALLGRPTIKLDGHPVTGFNSDKTRALLFYLATVPEPHSRPALAGLFWGDLPEDRAASNLRKSLASLRKVVGSYLTITRQQVAFCLDAPHSVDVYVLRAALARTNGQPDIVHLTEALALYRGDYLAEFFVRDALAFEEWMLTERRHLQEEVLAGLHTLAHYFADQGELGQAIHYAKRLLDIEPWREEVHRLLMALYVRSGQPGAAIGQFRNCREILRQELDVDVMPETAALYAEVRTQAMGQPHIQIETPNNITLKEINASSSVSWPPSQVTLPATLSAFMGRESELNLIKTRLLDERCRILTLLGTGGVGKTTLSIAAAHGLAAHYNNRAYFVELSHIDDPEYLAATILEQMAIPFASHQEPVAQLQQYLQAQRCLLILDNFEHLLAAVPWLSKLISAAAELDLLITSRQRLNLREEWVFEVGGLGYPNGGHWEGTEVEQPEWKLARHHLRNSPVGASEDAMLPADELAADEVAAVANHLSVQFFLAKAQQVQADFTPTDHDIGVIGQICRYLEGLPLAIELAATWMRLLSPQEILSELVAGAELLTQPHTDAPQRHQSLRTVFDQSWLQLTEQERATLRKLAVFRGGFTVDAAKAVAAGSIVELAALSDKSFLSRGDDKRFHIPEVLRRFAAEELARGKGETFAAHEAHRNYFLRMVHELHPQLIGPNPLPATYTIEADLGNVRAAWLSAVEVGAFELLRQATAGFTEFLMDRDRYFEAAHLLEVTLESLKMHTDLKADNAVSPRDLVNHLRVQLSHFYVLSDQLDRAEEMLNHGLDTLAQGVQTPAYTALVHHHAMYLYGRLGNPAEAERAGKQGLALYEQLADERSAAIVLNHLGILAAFRGEYDLALMRLEEAAVRIRSAGARNRLPAIYANLANVHGMTGNDVVAERLYREGQQLVAKFDKPLLLAVFFDNLGQHDLERSRYAKALTTLRQGYTIYRQSGIVRHLINNLNSQTQAHIGLGAYREAEACLRESINLSTTGDQSPWLHFEQALLLAKLLTINGKQTLAARLILVADDHTPDYAHMQAWATAMRASIIAELDADVLAATTRQVSRTTLVELLAESLSS